MSKLKEAVNNSETPAIATAVAALLTTVLSQYATGDVVPVIGTAVEAVNAFIAGNPLVGITALYGAFRLYKKWRLSRMAKVAVPAGPPTVTTGVLLLVAVLAGGGSSIAIAEEGRAVEVGLGRVDASGVGDEGNSYAAGWREPLGKTGRFAGHARLERLLNLGDDPGLDSYAADVDLLANWGMARAFQFYLGGGVGSVWTDRDTETVPVEPASVGKWGTTTPPTTPPAPLSAQVEDEDAYLRWSAVGGIRILFDDARRVGFGLEYRRSQPLEGGGDGERNQTQTALYAIIPAGK